MNAELAGLLSSLVPLVQSLLWVGLVLGILFGFRVQVRAALRAVVARVDGGADLQTPWFTLRGVPAAIKGDNPAVATAEGAGGAGDETRDVRAKLEGKDYPEGVTDRIYLVHAAETVRPRRADKAGLWRVRVWLEAYDPRGFGEVDRVTYRLYENDFPRPVVTTTNPDKEFELWLTVYGEFTVVAYVERRGKPPVWLTRYLDLPGRPPE